MKIDNSTIPEVYKVAQQFYEGTLTLQEGKSQLADKFRMNSSSASDYMYNFRYLMEGKKITRTLNAFSFDYFLDNIFKDYGQEKFSTVLEEFRK
ncbi:MAG TPA: hypothetical protein VK809_11425, partial [Bacteroidia bacterium]|nr:hypothetical protein [Bacteroidia bacterium]